MDQWLIQAIQAQRSLRWEAFMSIITTNLGETQVFRTGRWVSFSTVFCNSQTVKRLQWLGEAFKSALSSYLRTCFTYSRAKLDLCPSFLKDPLSKRKLNLTLHSENKMPTIDSWLRAPAKISLRYTIMRRLNQKRGKNLQHYIKL